MHSAKEVAFEKLQAAQFNAYDILRNAADRRLPGVEGAGSLHGERLWGCGAVGLSAPQSWTPNEDSGLHNNV